MATFQGEQFLAAQLDSIASQTWSHWRVQVSDDHSVDRTLAILEQYRRSWDTGRLQVRRGPGRGAHENFRSLLAGSPGESDAFAFADQDDVWEAAKLERAVGWLDTVSRDIPALYCSRTTIIDSQGRVIGQSPLFTRPPSFANALVQNIAGGNTMVFNRTARDLLVEVLSASPDAVIHDWWTYLMVTGAGGRVYYDAEPTVRYRQHRGNVVGAGVGLGNRAASFGQVVGGRLRRWNDRNVAALERVRDRLTPDNVARLECFNRARRRSLVPRLAGLRRAGVHRQTWAGNAGMVLAALLNRL